MALKLTRKGFAFIAVFAFVLLMAGSMFTAWYVFTEGGSVGITDSDAWCGLTGCDGGGGGDSDPSDVACTDGGYADSCVVFVCPNGCGGDGNSTTCNGREPGAYKRTVDCGTELDDHKDDDECGQFDYFRNGQYCQVKDVDCSCEPDDDTPPEDKPPVCDDLTINKSVVKSGSEEIQVTIKGSDPDGTPDELTVYAAADGQVNKNPGDLNCSSDPTSADYSFYCGGTSSWALAGKKTNGTSHTFTTTYNQLKSSIDGLSNDYEGNLNKKGIVLTGNVKADGNICSSNIAYNNGNGALYNGGSWDETCNGGCVARLEIESPPACDSLSISPKTVTSLSQNINISVKASDPDGTPAKIILLAAAGNQGPPNSSFDCVSSPTSASNYSYYCQGQAVFTELKSVTNNGTLTYQTTYQQLITKLKNHGINIDIEKNGVYITANITNDSDGNLCSSNIARNSGNGILWNNGNWDEACDGGCNENIKYIPPAPDCGDGNCDSGEYCDSNVSCIDGSSVSCRADSCTYCGDGVVNGNEQCDPNAPGETADTCSNACQRLAQPQECDDTCQSDNDCESPWTCDETSGRCRNPSCVAEASCSCPQLPVCGDGECNQDHEQCEENVSCIDGSAVSCRNNCTYCGDGIKNGNEQCDDGNDDDGDACRNDCTLPYCGDGNIDEGEVCDDGNDVDDDACSNDCIPPEPPAWTIEKEGSPQCVAEGKDQSATVTYKITVTNNGQGKGDLDRVVDTLDQSVEDEWVDQDSIEPVATYLQKILTWELSTEDMTMQPGEIREFVYMLNVPSTGFGTLTNTAEAFPVNEDSVSVVNQEVVQCASVPETGILDSGLAKIGIGLILISASGLYFYYEGTDGLIMRLVFKDEKVAHNRKEFEDKINGKEKK